MRYVRIFLLHFQDTFAERARSFVWFLIALINPLILLLFWRGAFLETGSTLAGWNLSTMASYYLLLIIAGAFLSVHIDEKIAYYDIQEGALSSYLIRPFSYALWNFFIELPYRILQGAFGVAVFLIFRLIFGPMIAIRTDWPSLSLAILIIVLGLLISFFFKMILGLSALWTTDYSGLEQFFEVAGLIFGGFVIPLNLLPDGVQGLAFSLPFSYIYYFPVTAIQGTLATADIPNILFGQIFWLAALYATYTLIWRRGIQKFTAVGQ